jgi:hypothetical protein
MVSLIMGLVVAMAAVGLARSATTTFHEQVRTSQTEMSLRMGAERLRQDLARTSYMSTGNIVLDPKVAQTIDAAKDPATAGPLIARYPALNTLRGIQIGVSAMDGGIPSQLSSNGLSPDSIELIGNYTTDDEYTGTISTGGSGTLCKTPQTITLDPQGDAAVYALAGGTSGTTVDTVQLLANAKTAFMPVDTSEFLARVTDSMGCTNFVPVCGLAISGNNLQVMVDGRTNDRAVMYANGGATALAHNCGSNEGGQVTIAPLMHVRWTIGPSMVPNSTDDLPEDPRFDLFRDVVDFDGLTIAHELVAEYAVDLKFGIAVDDPKGAGAARQAYFDLDSDNGTGNIYATTAGPDSTKTGFLGPQRVRSVRFRLAVRASVADRQQPLATDAGTEKSGTPTAHPIIARYCTQLPIGTCQQWARVRTIESEVALENQAGMIY